MAKSGIKKAIKRELVRAVLERSQSIDLEKLGAPKAEDAIKYDNVEEILNVPYMNRDEVPLGMDIFKPIVEEGKEMPVIVTIHGGGLTMGDRKISRPFGRILANKGYLVFSIEYRLAPRANVCMELDDICAGLDLVGQKLVDYDVDFDRIFIAAESAGAYLAAYVTAMKGSKKLQEAIGYEPTKVSFKAVGLMSGMLYTNRKDPSGYMLSDQIYGEKRADENFLQYMNPEHPEIINNIPPAYLITSKADFLNNYSILMNEALKKAGRPCHLLYYGDDELQHAFTTLQTENPKSIESIDKMLAWFEEQAVLDIERRQNAKALEAKKAKIAESIKNGKFNNQKIWQYVKECADVNPDRIYAPAIIDCSRTYTYGQMFEEWEKYAKVFTGLGITGENKSRAAIVGTVSAEPIFAFYGLNMTGACASMFSYPDLLPGGRWKTMVEKEHITDLILSDIMVTPQMWYEIKKAQKKLGIKNIILLHTRMGGPCMGPSEMLFNEFNYNALKRIPEVKYIDDLKKEFKDTEIKYAKKSGKQLAVITHTSGTSNGTRKPLPYTDKMVNCVSSEFDDGHVLNYDAQKGIKLMPPFDFSSSMSINGFVNNTLATGNAIVCTFFGFMHPKYVNAIKYYDVDITFTSGFMIESWMKQANIEKDTFAALKTIGIGGSYVSPAKVAKYEEFFKNHGFKGEIYRGYGMSEMAGGELFVPADCKDDILGYPDNVENYRIFDESKGKFFKTTDGVREGVLYGRSESMCMNVLDGVKLFETTKIDEKEFICTNDVVKVNEDGSFSYVGRANKFFANSDGVKFNSGIVETQLSQSNKIKHCAIIPVFDKRIHDTVPVLYVVPEGGKNSGLFGIKAALEEAYITGEELKGTLLPTQLVVVDSIPCNSNGKVDVFAITRSRIGGTAYNIIPVYKEEALVNIKFEKAENLNSYTGGTLPEGMGTDSAFGVFDLFSGTPAYFKYKKQVKTMAENTKNKVEKMKPKMPSIKMPDFGSDSHGMPQMPDAFKLPVSILSILISDQDNKSFDYED